MPNQVRPFSAARLALVAAALITLSLPARATLGGAAESIEVDRTHMKAMSRAQPSAGTGAGANYTVHAMTAPSGTAVREFATPDGKVFAVTWSGPSMPDLRQLLGGYFSTYATDKSVRRNGHAHRQVDRPDLVVRSSGHQRAFSGIAYVPSMIPTGVAIDDLQ